MEEPLSRRTEEKCPDCGTAMYEADGDYWCGECLEWFGAFSGGFISFTDLDVMNGKSDRERNAHHALTGE